MYQENTEQIHQLHPSLSIIILMKRCENLYKMFYKKDNMTNKVYIYISLYIY